MRICQADLSDPLVIALLELHQREMEDFSPPGTCHVLDLRALQADDIDVFAAWDGEQLLSVGALKRHPDCAEIKSMRAHPEARGIGAGRAMLEHLIARARALEFSVVRLETGSSGLFTAALGLYQSFGFVPCGSFAGYQPGEHNLLFELRL